MARQPRVVYWVVFLDALLMFAIVPLLPGYVRDLHLSKTEAGLIVGIYSGAVLLGSIPAGNLAARVGARRLTIFGVTLLAIATFGCGFAGNFWLLMAARIGQGLSSAVSWTAGMAWLSEGTEPGSRGRVLGMDVSNGLQVITAHVPQAELFSYATELRSLSAGRGTFASAFDHYEEVPSHIAEKVIADHRKEEATAH